MIGEDKIIELITWLHFSAVNLVGPRVLSRMLASNVNSPGGISNFSLM